MSLFLINRNTTAVGIPPWPQYLATGERDEGWTANPLLVKASCASVQKMKQVIQNLRRYFANEERSTWQPLPANPPGWVK
jgi:hypothetical protein